MVYRMHRLIDLLIHSGDPAGKADQAPPSER